MEELPKQLERDAKTTQIDEVKGYCIKLIYINNDITFHYSYKTLRRIVKIIPQNTDMCTAVYRGFLSVGM